MVAALVALGLQPTAVDAQPGDRPPPLPCPGNRLANPGFEAGFSARGRVDEVVPLGWSPWYETLPGVDGLNYPPEYIARRGVQVGRGLVYAGLWSAEQATSGATHTGGLYQTVAVPPGSRVLARAYAYGWATDGDSLLRSEPPGAYALSLGLDPRGGVDPDAASVTWTAPLTVTDAWLPLALDVPVPGGAVTLFTRGQALRRRRHNVSRWDHACLRVLGPIGVPTPSPTATAWPTFTPGPDAPTATPGLRALALEATRVAFDLEATAWLQTPARPPPALVSPAPRPTVPPPPPAAAEPPSVSLADRAADQLGLVLLALAAFAGGVAYGLGRQWGGGRDRPSASEHDQ